MRRWIVLCVVGACIVCQARTYYVDNGNAQANDANAGTLASPWKTIQKAANTVVAGDSAIVRSGTYNERVSFASGHSGTVGRKVVFQAQPRRTVFMRGFSTTSANHLRIEGFDITYNQGGWLGGGVWLSSDTVEVVDNYLHDIPGPGIQTDWSGTWDSLYIGGNHVYRCQYGITVGGTNILVENNEVERLFQFDTTGDCDYSRFFGDNITFRSNRFHGTVFSEVGNAHLDCWQTFDDNGEHATNVLWEANWCSECDEGLMAEAVYHHSSSNFVFRNNIFAHSAAWGLCVKDITGVKAYNNVFFDIQYHGAGFSGTYATGAEVRNNIFYKSETSYWADQGGQVTGSNNITFHSDSPGGAHDKAGVDPLFVDTASGNFHLRAGSPAIDSGTAVPVATDYDGNVRPYNSAFDIGAFEYGSSPAAVAPRSRRSPHEAHGLAAGASLKLYDLTGRRVAVAAATADGMVVAEDSRTGALRLRRLTGLLVR